MPSKEQALLRSKVEIHIRCPDAADALSNENSVVMRTAKMLTSWFGDARIKDSYRPCFNGHENIDLQVVFVVLSFCTTQILDMYILQVISYARNLAKEIGNDRIGIKINGTFISM